MLEYIFFDERPWRRFIEFLRPLGLEPEAAREDQGFMVRLPEDLDDALMDGIEAFYDEMLDLNEQLYIESLEETDEYLHTAGVSVNLADGRTVQAAVSPELLNRMMQVLSTDELGAFINAIVDAVEHPDERPICQRQTPA